MLRNGIEASNELTAHIRQIATEQKVKLGRVIAASGLPSAFVCGIVRPVLQELDDTLTVYRGVTLYNAHNIKALSWTLNKETAEWFAHRFNEDGTVYEAQIDKYRFCTVHIFCFQRYKNLRFVVHLLGG